MHPEVESKIKLRVVRSLGDTSPEAEENGLENNLPQEIKTELNENLLEDGVSLKTEEIDHEKEEHENVPENKSTEKAIKE